MRRLDSFLVLSDRLTARLDLRLDFADTHPNRANWSWGEEWLSGAWGKVEETVAMGTVSTGLQSYVTTMYGEKLDLFLQ